MGTLETCELKWLWKLSTMTLGFLWWLCADQESACQYREHWFNPWVRKIPWRRNWQPTPVFLPGESYGQRSLAGYSSRGHKESDMTERLSAHIYIYTHICLGLPRWLSGKDSTCLYRRCRLDPWIRKIPWRRKWHPTPILLPGKSHGQRSLVGYSLWQLSRTGLRQHSTHIWL